MNEQKLWISTEDLSEFLLTNGYKKVGQLGQSAQFRDDVGRSITLPLQENPTLRMLRGFILMTRRPRLIDADKFLEFINSRAPITSTLLQRSFESDSGNRKSVHDKILRERLRRLGSAPLDTIIREAGVVLEDRIRHVAKVTDHDLRGAALIDAVMTPGKAKIEFSSHPGEQDGARMLYRGAIQLIRNPAMHNLIDYPENEAENFVQIIDSLLLMLSRAKPVTGG